MIPDFHHESQPVSLHSQDERQPFARSQSDVDITTYKVASRANDEGREFESPGSGQRHVQILDRKKPRLAKISSGPMCPIDRKLLVLEFEGKFKLLGQHSCEGKPVIVWNGAYLGAICCTNNDVRSFRNAYQFNDTREGRFCGCRS